MEVNMCRGSSCSQAKAFFAVGWRVGPDPLSQQDLTKEPIYAQDKHLKRKTTNNNRYISVNMHIFAHVYIKVLIYVLCQKGQPEEIVNIFRATEYK